MSPAVNNSSPSPEMFAALEQAFAEFQSRAEKLSGAYAIMQEDVKKVNLELDRKNVELAESLSALERTQTFLNSILESMNNGVIAIDTAGRITQFNQAAADILGYTLEETAGKPYAEVFARERDKNNSLLAVLSSGTGHMRDEKVIWHKEGYPAPVSFQSALLKDQHGDVLGAVEIFSDISRIKALEEEMRRTKTMAALGEMSATVAHEIRNPLGAMGVWAGLLDRDFDRDDPRRGTLKKIIDGLGRLNRIVSNLLVYSRPIKAELRSVCLQDLLNETVNFIEIEIDRLEYGITVKKDWRADQPVCISVDPEKMQQVIMNLCLNAMQAMSAGGTLTVSVRKAPQRMNEYACFTVADTGPGIERERLDKIFDPFHTTKENGTGLGLAIVKKFIEHHSGYITVDSSAGKGTHFSVYVPLAGTEG
jgi:PAS domain S-box-containing protein